jgi:hypothetical protein
LKFLIGLFFRLEHPNAADIFPKPDHLLTVCTQLTSEQVVMSACGVPVTATRPDFETHVLCAPFRRELRPQNFRNHSEHGSFMLMRMLRFLSAGNKGAGCRSAACSAKQTCRISTPSGFQGESKARMHRHRRHREYEGCSIKSFLSHQPPETGIVADLSMRVSNGLNCGPWDFEYNQQLDSQSRVWNL